MAVHKLTGVLIDPVVAPTSNCEMLDYYFKPYTLIPP
jgi:hypothetical protein